MSTSRASSIFSIECKEWKISELHQILCPKYFSESEVDELKEYIAGVPGYWAKAFR